MLGGGEATKTQKNPNKANNQKTPTTKLLSILALKINFQVFFTNTSKFFIKVFLVDWNSTQQLKGQVCFKYKTYQENT